MRYFILEICILLVLSCSREKDIFGPDTLQDKMIGLWNSHNSSIQFNRNNTFIDSTFGLNSYNDKSLSLRYVFEGKYFIEEDILIIKDFKITFAYVDSTVTFPLVASPYSRKCILSNDSLILRDINIFDFKNSNHNDLTGTWSETRDVCVFKTNPLQIEHIGRIKYIFSFSTPIIENDYQKYNVIESSEFIDGYKDNSLSMDYSCTYKPPFLIMPFVLSPGKIVVEFNGSKMYWIRETKRYGKIIK
jgi:hypothetical protein